MVNQSQFIEKIGDTRTNPKGWDVYTLKELVVPSCPISYGIVQPGDDIEEGGVPIVRPVDLDETHRVTAKGLKRTTKEISDAYKRTILEGNELLLCVRGTTGLVGLATDELKGCNVTRGITPLSFNEKADRVFMLCTFLSDGIQEFISDNTIGSALRGINMAVIREMKIPTPPVHVQKSFADLYIQADKSKFAGFKSQFIEDYYNRYEPTNLGAHISVIRGVSYKPADIRETGDEAVAILRSNNISDGEINYEDLVYVSPTCVSEKQFVDAGDIVMCGSNGSKKLVGKAGLIAEKQSRTSFGAFCLGIRCKKTLAPEYLNAFFNSQMYRDIIEELGNGTNIINIRPDHITSLSIPIPEKNVQNEFVELTRQADKSKYLN